MSAANALTLWRLWRREREEPAPFYRMLADRTVDELEGRYGPIGGFRVLDLGCGGGFYADAFRRRGADVIAVDNDPRELSLAAQVVPQALLADAADLPLADESVDAVFCSNLLEHTPNPDRVLDEIERVLRPGGWAYVSWTNWYSPWGGHEMVPYHYLGPRRGSRLYERVHGPPRKNAYGAGLWAVHIGPTLRGFRSRPRMEIEAVEPRYWPRLSHLCRLPLLRELVTWNCVIRARKKSDRSSAYAPTGKVRRLISTCRADGSADTLKRALGWSVGYARGLIAPPAPGTFTLGGEPHTYFHHRYNGTWLNERAVEVAVGLRGLESAPGGRVLEIGHVLGHYLPCRHRVVDKYERAPRVIPLDVLEYRPGERYDLIVSLSTLEHVGWDERPRDPGRALKAIDHLCDLLAPGGRLLVTLPVGANPVLDRAIAAGETPFTTVRALRRPDDRNAWREVEPSDVWDAPYDHLLYQARGLLVCELRAGGGGPGAATEARA